MTEQQYTCPSCHKDYTRFTIQEHYGCGVQPLEVVKIEPVSLESLTAIAESSKAAALEMAADIGAGLLEVVEQVYATKTIELKPLQNEDEGSNISEAESKAPYPSEQDVAGVSPGQEVAAPHKPEPKKRGRPAKVK